MPDNKSFCYFKTLFVISGFALLNLGKEHGFVAFAGLQFIHVSYIITSVAVFYPLISRCSAVGSAPALGAGCREFESLHLDHIFSDLSDFSYK